MAYWLNKPYPLLEKNSNKLLLAFGFAIFTSLFLLIYKPFGAKDITSNQTIFLCGFGFCVFLGLVLNYFLLPKLLLNVFNPEKWQVKKEVIYIIWSFLLISIFNYFYNTIIGKDIAPYRNWLEFFGITISIGIFPLLILIYLVEKKQSQKNIIQAKILSKTIKKDKTNLKIEKSITIVPETLKSEPLTLNVNDFIFAVSDNNYVTVYFVEKNRLNQKLLRLSLKNLESQLSKINTIFRCHKSYLINKQKIITIKGNARSLVIFVEFYNEAIPISRNFPKEKLI